MKLYSENNNYKLYEGNMLDMLEVIPENSIDSIITDPPYELGFMGKSWDSSGIAFQKETWERCLKVLKPGGHMLAFGGTRTYHRIACAIEDAGFEIRDCIMWVYGSGFPKSMNIGLAIDKKNGVESIDTGIVSPNARPNSDKTNTLYESGTVGKNFTIKKATNEWEGWGTSLKPSYEPIIVARKPVENTIVDNVMKYGVGGINIDECRVSLNNGEVKHGGFGNAKSGFQKGIGNSGDEEYKCEWVEDTKGRFPANLIHDGSEEVVSLFPDRKDDGSAARFFYCAKASKKDRDEGLEEFESKVKVFNGQSSESSKEIKDVEQRFTTIGKNVHPTVKPTDLMGYLVRLVSPKGATILDPFNGSGSTGKAVMFENRERDKDYKYIGIELTPDYLPISKARIEYAQTCSLDKEERKESNPNLNRCEKTKRNSLI